MRRSVARLGVHARLEVVEALDGELALARRELVGVLSKTWSRTTSRPERRKRTRYRVFANRTRIADELREQGRDRDLMSAVLSRLEALELERTRSSASPLGRCAGGNAGGAPTEHAELRGLADGGRRPLRFACVRERYEMARGGCGPPPGTALGVPAMRCGRYATVLDPVRPGSMKSLLA